jgi:S-DNA-T family DNA segregation ATPase FtsK/SpoIIIE
MEKKILRIQLYSLFVLTTLNLVYFYYRDTLPDNYFEITYQNQSINFFTYYLFSFLANFGYWCGIWITSSFITFAILHSFVLNKKKDVKNQFVLAALIPFSLSISYLLIPETLGEGLLTFLKENVSIWAMFSSMLLFGLSFFYLVAEKSFFKTCRWTWKQLLSFVESIRSYDFSKFKNFDYQAIVLRAKSFSSSFIHQFRKTDVTETQESKKSFIERSNEPAKREVISFQGNLPVEEPQNEELIAEEELEEELEEEILDSSDIDLDDEEIYEDEDLSSTVSLPEEKFFSSEELIGCIEPKNQAHKTSDPSEQYFVTIAKAIEVKLKEFNISASVINVLKGPVVDTFELELGSGVKVASINNKADDLSLALMGAPIRIVYPMRGKSTIGIEVPRNPRDVIYLDEVLRSPNFNNSNYKLPIAMGKDAYGEAAVIDLAGTPHLLVAGTTGAGKSVFVNTLLVSLIIKFSPKKLRLIMLDPKQLELALYQRLPHLIMPVVTDPSIASAALLWAIDEMERRYSLLKDFGVKNIEGFNKKITGAGTDLTCKITKYYPDAEVQGFELPYIVVVVDEFADLMLSKSGKAIETSISRLAAKARASGIHIVLATQRPSTDIITGVIKANFPTRVSFRVFTNIDSRVILDGIGAEKLLGKGDMLFKQGIDILRMHSAFVNEEEIEALVDKLATLPVQYDTGAMEFLESNGTVDTDVEGITSDGEGGALKDDKYEEAVRCVATHRVASASFLQRRLGVGYNRAANLIEEMERHGVVGPAQGSKPRKVLVPPPADLSP